MYQDINEITEKFHFLPIGEANGKIKQIKGILSNSKPKPQKLFVAEGIWILQMCEKFETDVDSLILCPEHIRTAQARELAAKLAARARELYTVSAKTYEKISERGQPDGLMALCRLPRFEIENFRPPKNAVILVLDGIEIPGNVGTMLRMADGAGLDGVFICNRKARLTHPKLIKGSQGAVLSVPTFEFETVEECRAWLKNNGFTVYLADTRAALNYYEEPFGVKCALVMGSERYGISREWYDGSYKMIAIPMLGNCDSLNVGVAATVLAYEASLKNKLNGGHEKIHENSCKESKNFP